MPGTDRGSTVKPLHIPQSQLDTKDIRRWEWINTRPFMGKWEKRNARMSFTALCSSDQSIFSNRTQIISSYGYFKTKGQQLTITHIKYERVDVIQQPPYNQGRHQKGWKLKRKGIHKQMDRQLYQNYTAFPQSQTRKTFGFWKCSPALLPPPLDTSS